MPTDDADPWLWGVDRSWTDRVPANLDGDVFPSKVTKLHLTTEDTTAKCSRRILLNSLQGDRPAGRLSDFEGTEYEGMICRRCVPRR